jgi:RNA polymerase-interacting CarD/CdnL/TRCF family regulator
MKTSHAGSDTLLPTWMRSPEPACTPGGHLFHVRHGVVVVEQVEPREGEGVPASVVVVRTLDTGLTISVPLASVERSGLRRVIDPGEAEVILAKLREQPGPLPAWSPRSFEATQRTVFGRDPLAAAAMLRDLHGRAGRAKLRSRERPLLSTGMELLAAELAVALGVTKPEAMARIDEALRAGGHADTPKANVRSS